MFDLDAPRSGFGQFVVMATGVKMARALASARNRARAAWMAEHGLDPELWPLLHPRLVLCGTRLCVRRLCSLYVARP
jgi:hypothetical protein